MKCKLSDICDFRKGKVDVSKLTLKTYISTENMLPNKGGITDASSLPTIQLTQEYKKGDVLISNIRPYFKKVWRAKYDGGCSNDVLVFQGNSNIDGDFLYYVLANDDFFDYSMATSKGTKMPRGDKASIMQYEVPVFDVDTQRKIASVLRCLDEKIELNSVINKNLFEQVQTIYKDRYINLSPFDRTIPVGWHVGTASEIIEFLFISVFFTIFLSKLLRIQAIFLCVARSGISISKFSISEGLIAGYADAVCSATA